MRLLNAQCDARNDLSLDCAHTDSHVGEWDLPEIILCSLANVAPILLNLTNESGARWENVVLQIIVHGLVGKSQA